MAHGHGETQQFVDAVKSAAAEGYRFVFVVGAGLSAPSGFPIISDLEIYLRYWILRALHINPFARPDEDLTETFLPRWNPRSGDWPSFPEEVATVWSRSPSPAEISQISREHFDGILLRALQHCPSEKQQKLIASEKLIAQALGHARDWRMALHLLASLVFDGDDLKLVAPDPAVVDSCFRFLLRGCSPSLAHRMIVALCPVLRVNAIVSTNFDDLIERAFVAVPSPLTVYDVPEPVPLPSAGLVRNQRSLVKVNGGVFNLRADYTIDQSDPRDNDTFCGYLVGRSLSSEASVTDLRNEVAGEKVAVFVSGVGHQEPRTVAMLRRALDIFDSSFRVFWLSYIPEQPSVRRSLRLVGTNKKLVYLSHQEQGQLLLQIYQACTGTVPTSGVPFPGLWQIAAPPLVTLPPSQDAEVRKWTRQICVRVNDEFRKPSGGKRPPLLVLFGSECRGATAICSLLFENAQEKGELTITGNPRFAWVDLEQVTRPVGILLRLVQLAARYVGEPDPANALDYSAFERNDQEEYRRFSQALMRVLRAYYVRRNRPLVMLINVEEGAGTYPALNLTKITSPEQAHSPDPSWRDKEQLDQLLHAVGKINADPSCGVQFIFFARERLSQHNVVNFAKSLRGHPHILRPCATIIQDLTGLKEEERCRAAMRWADSKRKEQSQRLGFLYLLTLFRHVRYAAGLFRCVGRDYEVEQQRLTTDPLWRLDAEQFEQFANATSEASDAKQPSWLSQLAKLGIVRWQGGGLIWMTSSLKPMLQEKIEARKLTSWASRRLFLEGLVARWYGRVLLSSSDPLAAVEAIHHAIHATWNHFTQSKPHSLDTGQVIVILEHARLVLDIATPLFVRRASEQFSDAALTHLQVWATSLLHKAGDCHDQGVDRVQELVRHLYWKIVLVRANTYLNEAEFAKVQEVSRAVSQAGVMLEPSTISKSFDQMTKEERIGISYQRELELTEAAAHLSLRNGGEAARLLNSLWKAFAPTEVPIGDASATPWSKLTGRLWVQDWLQNAAPDIADEFGRRLLVRLAWWCSSWYFYENQVDSLYASQCQKRDATRQRREALNRSLWFIDFGLELLRAIPHVSNGFVFDENVRFRAQAALCYSYLADLHGTEPSVIRSGVVKRAHAQPDAAYCGNMMRRAQMLLADASAYVDENPSHEAGPSRAIINLRRAEVYLVTVHSRQWFFDLRSCIFKYGRGKDSQPNLAQTKGFEEGADRAIADFRNEASSFTLPIVEMNQIHGVLYDALIRLDRAETELIQHPKSRWWWWILCVLKSRIGEYFQVLIVAQKLWPRARGSRNFSMPFRLQHYLSSQVYVEVNSRLMRDPLRLGRLVASLEGVFLGELILYNLGSDLPAKMGELQDRAGRLLDLVSRARHFATQHADASPLRAYVRECCRRAESIALAVGGESPEYFIGDKDVAAIVRP